MTAIRYVISILILFGLITCPRISLAATHDYTISADDTPNIIDTANTTAIVDTTKREISLPCQSVPNLVSFWPTGEMDYIVMTSTGVKHFSFNGTNMVENELLKVDISNPLALAATDPYPDVVVADNTGIKHYSFNGEKMVYNSSLSAAGLTGIAAVGAAGENELAVLIGDNLQHYSFNGATMGRNTLLEPPVSLTNPIDIALGSGGYDLAVLEHDRVRWFNFNGSGMSENPALAVTGLTSPRAFAVADPENNWDVAVVDGAHVKHYSYASDMNYVSALSITSGLTAPRAVALRPGSYDRIVVDGNMVKYYQWNGSMLEYNESLSKSVEGIIQGGIYKTPAVITSKSFSTVANVSKVRVRAAHELPIGTSVTWSVTANGTNWVKKWRVRGVATGTILEVSTDNGSTWNQEGTASDAMPSSNNKDLWTDVTPGKTLKWKAELATTNLEATPKIATNPRGGVGVCIDYNIPPNKPVLPPYGGVCFTTTTPELTWMFSDDDPGDSQSAYQVQIVRISDAAVIYDTGKVKSSSNKIIVPTSQTPETPGPLWNGGDYRYKYKVMVWDQSDASSPWSDLVEFCVIAFERPRIANIVSPPQGQVPVDPLNPATHIMIKKNMTQAKLPKAKAGAKVVLLVDSIGQLNSFTAAFPYSSLNAITNTPAKMPDGTNVNPMYPTGNPVNCWSVEFWTDPSLEVCPSGTLVTMKLDSSHSTSGAKLYAPTYAAGVIETLGSIYSDWIVVLQGRDN